MSWHCLTCWPVKLWRCKMMSLVNKSADCPPPNYHKILIFFPTKLFEKSPRSQNRWIITHLVTAHNSSCGKVMFSQVCVIPSVWGLGGSPWRGMHPGVCIQGDMPSGVYIPEFLHRGGLGRLPNWILWDTVNVQVVRILLECILVFWKIICFPFLTIIAKYGFLNELDCVKHFWCSKEQNNRVILKNH